jgi:hypothetical protein
MPDEQKKIVPINYTNREFETIRRDLFGIAERFYPDTFRDFSQNSFGSLMIDAVSYVGDQLSFYLDYNVNESFLDTAYQYDNVLRLGQSLGYRYSGPNSSYGQVTLYILVPASSNGIGPDTRYIPILKRGSTFKSTTGISFVLTKNVDFSLSSNPVITARTNASTGAPTHYAIKAYGDVVAGNFSRLSIDVGDYERFKKVAINNANISEIISVTDSDGNEYYEVDYLAQDVVFREVLNTNYKNDNVPSIIKPFLVSRKFVVERTRTSTILQFGSGDSSLTDVIANPTEVAMQNFGKDYVTDTTFDPSRLSKNQSFGIVPSNTTLEIVYRFVDSENSNIATSTLTQVGSVSLEFKDQQQLDSSEIATVRTSIECSNEEPIVGSVVTATTDEIKRRIYDTFPTQNRAVTQTDYENLAYRMPKKFGSVKRVSVQRDPNSNRRNLNMYILSEDNFGKFTTSNSTIKNNLKTWINHYRMISDTVDILDAYIVNFGIDFIVKPSTGVDKFDLLNACVAALQAKFSDHFFIGEHINISEIYSELSKVKGVLDVIKVKIIKKEGSNYASVDFNINHNTSPDGTSIIAPKNAVFELKYPQVDIKGRIR